MNIQEKAARAKRLREDEAFASFVAEVREDAIRMFTNSGTKDTATREEAHALLRAVQAIETRLDAAIDAQTIAERQHRD